MRRYKYSNKAGALQEAMPMSMQQDEEEVEQLAGLPPELPDDSYATAHNTGVFSLRELGALEPPTHAQSTRAPALYNASSATPSAAVVRGQNGRKTMFFYTIEDGQQAFVVHRDGSTRVAKGPCRIFRWGKQIRPMEQHVAHPGEFLIVRYRDGRQEHISGPAHVWLDTREHMAISKEDCIQIAEKEAIVVYSRTGPRDDGDRPDGDRDGPGQQQVSVARRIVHGPDDFVPQPGEWLHTFSWHGSRGGKKVPNALVFQKLWLLPDQMYHDIPDVRTADGVVITIRLMLFFHLTDIEKMLETTHDPIGDFVNAATSDVVTFVGNHDFESFKHHTGKLNDLSTYEQLTSRAQLCGYVFDKVVYRGYGAPEALQQMHEQAMESRTRLQLEKATEEQAQELEDLKLERRLAREGRERDHRASGQDQELQLMRKRSAAELEGERERRVFSREQAALDDEQAQRLAHTHQAERRKHLEQLAQMGVELTTYLTQGRADQVIELRGDSSGGAQLHLHEHGRQSGE